MAIVMKICCKCMNINVCVCVCQITELLTDVERLKQALNGLSQLAYTSNAPNKRQTQHIDTLHGQIKSLQQQLAVSGHTQYYYYYYVCIIYYVHNLLYIYIFYIYRTVTVFLSLTDFKTLNTFYTVIFTKFS